VFHTAVRNNTDVELASYEQFLASNVDGTFNVLLAALRLGVRRVVYSSTAMVNGFHETAAGLTPGQGSAVRYDDVAPRRGLDVYGLTKTLAEITADYFRDRHGLSVIGLRYGWFAPLDMYRDPAMVYNTLQFCFHEQDALAANLLAMDQTTVGDYLICAPTRFTDADAPELWRRPEAALARHYPGELDYLRSIGFDPTPIPAWLDCSRAMRELGYRPRFDFPRFVQMHRESHRASGR
jgi:nucleoside-diphosphate-sugar epimerase